MLKLGIGQLVDYAKGKTPSIKTKRCSDWAKIRKQHLLRNPRCAVCGGTKKLEVHHIEPFHMNPARERDPTNLMTLCESRKRGLTCHLFVGHKGNYRNQNLRVIEDAQLLYEMFFKEAG